MGNPCKGVILDTSLGIRGIWWPRLSQVLSRTCLHIARKILFPLRFKYEYFHPLISSLWLRWKQKNLCLFLNFLGCFLQFCKYWTLIVESSTALTIRILPSSASTSTKLRLRLALISISPSTHPPSYLTEKVSRPYSN